MSQRAVSLTLHPAHPGGSEPCVLAIPMSGLTRKRVPLALPVPRLVVWCATFEDTVRHGYWMRGSTMPFTCFPTQLCDVNVMVACPYEWSIGMFSGWQPAKRCSDCEQILFELLEVACWKLPTQRSPFGV